MMLTPLSTQLFKRAAQVLVGGVNSPVRAFRAVGGDPLFIERAEGPFIFDVDGNRYIDLVGSWGSAIVGHAHPQVVKAVNRATADGLSFGACCKVEVELAELITQAIPSMERIRFVSSGTEAAMSAIRLARASTGRTKILKFLGCYHGHSDGLLVSAGSGAATFGVPDSAGVPAEFAAQTLLAPFNDLHAVEQIFQEHGRELAAIIVEPVAGNMGLVLPQPGFLDGLRSLGDQQGALLIFDEVMTGFRVRWGGYQNLCGVTPDLTCLGKIIGGGLPVAAYGGPANLMNRVSPLGPVYQAGTLSGNPPAMTVGIATLNLCNQPGFYDQLTKHTAHITDQWHGAASEAGLALQTSHCGGMLGLAFTTKPITNFAQAQGADHDLYARFFHAMLDRGVFLPPSGYEAMFLSTAHNDEIIDQILSASRNAFWSLRS